MTRRSPVRHRAALVAQWFPSRQAPGGLGRINRQDAKDARDWQEPGGDGACSGSFSIPTTLNSSP